MAMTMMRPASILLLALAAATPVCGMPYFLITNSRPMCFTVEGPRETSVLIQYFAPDLTVLPEDDSAKLDAQKHRKRKDVGGYADEEGLDTRFNQRYRSNLEMIKKAGRTMSDMSIVVQQRGDTVGGLSSREWRRRDKLDSTTSETGRIREELSEVEGSFTFTTGRFDGPIEMCFQSMSASVNAAVRLAVNVTQQVEENASWQQQKQRLKDSLSSTDEEGVRKAKVEFSRMAGDLKGLERKIQLMLSNADYSKEQEINFHEQSVAMNRASQYWPMIHVAVLLLTGFTQANHIVRFFKSRHVF